MTINRDSSFLSFSVSNGGVKSGVLEVNFSRCPLPLSPKSPFGGQIGVLEVLFGAVRDFLTNNDQQRQIKAVLDLKILKDEPPP